MRLSQNEIEAIKQVARSVFGKNTCVMLFGSRTDDHKKGGDIDLFVKNDNESVLTLEAKVSFLAKIKQIIGDQKIDVVFDNAVTRRKINFYRSIQEQKIEL